MFFVQVNKHKHEARAAVSISEHSQFTSFTSRKPLRSQITKRQGWDGWKKISKNMPYTCNNCKSHVETRYHCTVCDDFDLCVNCKDKDGHPHPMEKLGFALDNGSPPADAEQTNPQEPRELSIQRCILSLVHACLCRDANNCRLPSCQKMKRVVMHTKNCRRTTEGRCPICKQLLVLCCYHAKHCQKTKCLVPFCSNIKHMMKQQRSNMQKHAPRQFMQIRRSPYTPD
ncbi:histone lysine acetyltransferase CREBBP-like isoform X1 [Temnothorax longispinosus]|uniref:histone acetyltransferase n=1 Tax=Temnothorax longispinosus TaxID=300112 RepID=A0A4S2JUM0_9HYME|nr:Protein cbp-1 [Temnothorax longispinosus]